MNSLALPCPFPPAYRTLPRTFAQPKQTRGRNDCKKALCAATKYMIGVVVIVALIAGILFAVLGQSDVPVKDFEVRSTRTDPKTCPCDDQCQMVQ